MVDHCIKTVDKVDLRSSHYLLRHLSWRGEACTVVTKPSRGPPSRDLRRTRRRPGARSSSCFLKHLSRRGKCSLRGGDEAGPGRPGWRPGCGVPARPPWRGRSGVRGAGRRFRSGALGVERTSAPPCAPANPGPNPTSTVMNSCEIQWSRNWTTVPTIRTPPQGRDPHPSVASVMPPRSHSTPIK